MTGPQALLLWLALYAFLAAASHRPAVRLFGRSAGVLGLPLVLLVWSWLYWIAASLVRLPDGRWAVALAGLLAVGLVYAAGATVPEQRSRQERDGRAYAVFAVALAAALGIRIWSSSFGIAERYSDMVFFQGALLDGKFPPQDRWLSGLPLNYYYFGQLLFAVPTRALGLPPEIAVNLSTSTVAAMTASTAYALLRMLGAGGGYALWAAAASILFGNWEWIRQAFAGQGWAGFSWWDSSRAMPGTITEFPYFSFLLGDYHAHYLALPWLGLALATALALRRKTENVEKRGSGVLVALCALAVGVHYPLNPWELPFAALLTALLLGRAYWATAQVGVLSFLLFLPFWIAYERPVTDLGMIPPEQRSPLGLFLLHWGPFFAPLVVLVGLSLRTLPLKPFLRWSVAIALTAVLAGPAAAFLAVLLVGLHLSGKLDPFRPSIALLLGAFAAIALCEFVHFDNLYGPELRRMNTVFKFYTMAWWALALAVPLFASENRALFAGKRSWALGALAVVVLPSLVYPVAGTARRAERFAPAPTLDGLLFWDAPFPGEREAVAWLRANTFPSDVLLEATGPAYQHFSRFSAFSGRPTVLGWANHEWVWRRKGFEKTQPRQEEIERLLREPSAGRLDALLKKYNVTWIAVGHLERKGYPPALLAEIAKFPAVYDSPEVKFHRVGGP